MHILHLIKTSEGATWAIQLLQELKKNYKTLTFSVVIPQNGKHFKEYEKLCKHVYEFDFTFTKEIIKNGRKLKEIVRRDNPDLIHSWFSQTTLYARLFLRAIPIPRIFQVAGPAHLDNYIFRFCDIFSAQNNDYWIATSKYIFDIYKRLGVSSDRLILNYAYIDIDKLLDSKSNVTLRNLRKELNIEKNIKLIGTASYIYPPKFYQKVGIKGHEKLLQAFKELIKIRDDVVLIIAGSSFDNNLYYEKQLKSLANSISPNKIFFTGKYQQAHEIIPNFDIFCYLSLSENLGGVFESLLFEVPTLSSNKGALPELVINNYTGFNVSPTEIRQIVFRLNQMLDHPTSPEILQKGKQKVIQTFDKTKIICNTYDFYCKVSNSK